ncbi:MAG: uroporphyrinogen decarboxylase family protein [Anaerolineae bacterium]
MPVITPRQRMLNAYLGRWSDRYPVAPEFWCYLPARLLGIDMVTLEREVPHWQALLETFRHYECEGWGIVAPGRPNPQAVGHDSLRALGSGRYESVCIVRTPHGPLRTVTLYDRTQPSWVLERPVKDLARDEAAWLDSAFPPIELHDYDPVRRAQAKVREDYLLEVYVGGMFFDFIANPVGLEAGIAALQDHPEHYRSLLARYLEYITAETHAVCDNTADAPLFIGCGWSCAALIGPRLWRTWDLPVVQAITTAAHQHNRLVHLHYHGPAMANLPDLLASGADCICPFERPPGGDIIDLPAVRRVLNGQAAFNGNVHTVEALIRGDPAVVEGQVAEIIAAFEGEPRLIIGTGDQVGGDTPDENIWAMIESGIRLGVHNA